MAREMKIGDKVLCILNHKEYVIDGFSCCPGCGKPTVFLVGKNKMCNAKCCGPTGCGYLDQNVRIQWNKESFILPDLESLHQHRVEVSAKELLTVKEIQNQ